MTPGGNTKNIFGLISTEIGAPSQPYFEHTNEVSQQSVYISFSKKRPQFIFQIFSFEFDMTLIWPTLDDLSKV